MDVLIVDDNPIDLAITARFVKEVGHNPISCQSGKEALAYFQSDLAPNLIITDWHMPEMDGSELCQKLRTLPSSITPYIIMTTADTLDDAEVNALETGADDFIEKPMSIRSFSARIRVAERIISAQLKLRNLALTDELTGLFNRRAGMNSIQSQLARMTRHEQGQGCMILSDIDYFKRINDTYGHGVGDIVLKEVSSRLIESLRPFDTVCRYGGEEFLIYCETSDLGQSEIEAMLRRVKNIITNEPVLVDDDVALNVTISIGCYAHSQSEKLSMSQLINHADRLLYEAKGSGRNCYVSNLGAMVE